jgi:hypothetical protein
LNSAAVKKQQPRYVLLVDWNRKYDWPTQGALRYLMQYRATNGFESAFVKIGRRVVIDEAKFFECVARQSEKEACHARRLEGTQRQWVKKTLLSGKAISNADLIAACDDLPDWGVTP